ncbi:hypothetical protein OPV22_011092 [Ensete ventricosum]|uniref:Uncharacterized protein n=1 Tax=Ensete ventricosum TaxID=4639 RepID=A0AAV8Q4D0_ENSVE|nr:hypothetical protein OPV22_011092 [Ensete ventricosum]
MDSPENCRKDRALGFGFDASSLKRWEALSAGNELLRARKAMCLFGPSIVVAYCCRALRPTLEIGRTKSHSGSTGRAIELNAGKK